MRLMQKTANNYHIIENTNQDQYGSDRQDAWHGGQKDTPIKRPDNRQVLGNLEAYVQDKHI